MKEWAVRRIGFLHGGQFNSQAEPLQTDLQSLRKLE